jgi:hypothetical protein
MRDDKGRPTPKAVAWALWGGDAGFSNVKRIRESMLAEERGPRFRKALRLDTRDIALRTEQMKRQLE